MRSDIVFWLVFLISGGLVGAVCDATEKPEAFLNDEGWLKHDLVLRDAQEGFVGVSGQVLTITKSGEWTRAHFVNQTVQKPHDKGRLTKVQVRKLAKTLAKNGFHGLPASFGREVPVNRRFYELRFDRKSTQLVLNPGESLRELKLDAAEPEAKTWEQFQRVIRTIEDLVPQDPNST